MIFFGTALHLSGDIFAHKTIVPNYTIAGGMVARLQKTQTDNICLAPNTSINLLLLKILQQLEMQLKQFVKRIQ